MSAHFVHLPPCQRIPCICHNVSAFCAYASATMSAHSVHLPPCQHIPCICHHVSTVFSSIVQLSKEKQPELLTNEKIEPPENNETGIVKPGTRQSDLASSVDTISRVVGSDSPPHYSCGQLYQHNPTSNESLGYDSKQSVMVESLTKGKNDITPVPVTFNFVKHETIDSSSEQQSTPPLLKTLNSLNSNEQISSFPLFLVFNNLKQDLLNKHNEHLSLPVPLELNVKQELLNKNNEQHSSLPVPLELDVKQELLNKNNEQHSSLPVPLLFNKIKTEILTDKNEKHLYFPVPLTFNHVKQELLIKSREQLPSQNVPGPPTSTAPGSEVMECEFITTDLLKMGGLLDLQEQGKNIEQSKGSPKQQR
uniref:Uncharacterized protein n=1 Tax=Timema poppense TaxID=170557 RepID=A0A7R9DFX0_TIMPO|nr:unnamed protein product [Timema poppensis]